MYPILELIRQETDFCCKADKNMRSAQQRYRKDNRRHVRLGPICLVGDYILLDRARPLRSATENHPRSIIISYYPQIGPYKVTGISKNILHTNQDGLENTVSIDQAALSPISRRHCADTRTAEAERQECQKPRSESHFDEGRSSTERAYVTDTIVRHIKFGQNSTMW